MKTALTILALFALTVTLPFEVAAKVSCKEKTTLAQLRQAGADGEKSFADMDKAALLSFAARAREEILPCLKEIVTPKEAAAFHRLMALEAFMRKNNTHVRAEFHAARKLDPGYKFPEEVFGAQHPLSRLYASATMSREGTLEIIYPPITGYVMVGGVRNAPRPELVPVIVQVCRADNSIVETRYFKPGETLPNWGKVNPLGVTALDLGIDTRSIWTKPEGYYISSAVFAVLAGTFYGLALMEKGRFEDSSTSDGDLGGHRTRANAFGYTSIATASLAVVLTGIGVGVHVKFGGSDSPKLSVSSRHPLGIDPNGFRASRASPVTFGGSDVRF